MIPTNSTSNSAAEIPLGRELFFRCLCVGLLLSVSIRESCGQERAEELEFFESRIRPVLIEHCYSCHNSTDTAEGGLSLDHRDAMKKDGDSGSLIDLKNPSGSLLLSVIRHDIEGLEMPDGGPKLDDGVIADFETWIRSGAIDPRNAPPSAEETALANSWDNKLERRKQWWSFQPISEPPVPSVGSDWSDHPVDRFLHQTWNKQQLNPGERAESYVLVRRLFFNLVGLPPTIVQARAWTDRLQSCSPDEREKVVESLVDELLASPHFGERWARHWMDWIRYAESHGSEGDPGIDNAWHYRDYLIRALNEDISLDQLLKEHVAGDLLTPPRINEQLGINESAIGPSHWRMVFHGFAPTDALDEKVRFTDDQINAFSKAFLGLTVSCARCHDHKFDAISQKDYYALFGILGSCRPGRTVIDTPSRQQLHSQALVRLKRQIHTAIAKDWKSAVRSIAERLQTNDDANRSSDKASQSTTKSWLNLVEQTRNVAEDEFSRMLEKIVGDHRRRRTAREDFFAGDHVQSWDLSTTEDFANWFPTGHGLSNGPSANGEFSIAPNGPMALRGIYPAGVYSHSFSEKHAALLSSPNFELPPDCELFVESLGGEGATVRYVVQNYPRSGTVYPVTALKNEWRFQRYDMTYWQGDNVHIELTTARDAPLLTKNNDRSWFGVRRIVLQKKERPDVPVHDSAVNPVIDLMLRQTPESFIDLCHLYEEAVGTAVDAWVNGTANNDQAALLDACLRSELLPNRIDKLPEAAASIQEYRRLESEIPTPIRVPGLQEIIAADQPLLHRGDHKQPRDAVPRRFLEAIDDTPYETTQSGRMELAEDLLRRDNPLTKRVIVNRVWHHLFGRGIVATPDNLGRLGAPPTHPELLDWLATQFEKDGWSMKRLIRSLVLSKTWQLSSRPTSSASRKDPENLYLSHANVRRLEAEAIRDALLSVSGELDPAFFGSPVSSDSRRRSIYVRVIRNSLDPFLRAFDFPEPFSSVGRRDVTNVPAQSLALLNSKQVQRHALRLAERLLAQPDRPDDDKIQDLFCAAFGRRARDEEIHKVHEFLEQCREDISNRRLRLQSLRDQLVSVEAEQEELLSPVRLQLLEQIRSETGEDKQDDSPLVQPLARWTFDQNAEDDVGNLDLKLQNGARIADGALIVDGKGFAVSPPLASGIQAKTLQVRLKLDNLSQRAGGAMTVQTPDGVFFDSIVFAEQSPGEWLAGSNNFARTQSFGGSKEESNVDKPIHFSIVYQPDGTIVGYRNGEPYGEAYRSNGPFSFQANNAVISFGVRHFPAVGNRMLKAKILDAQLFDRALTPDEVASTAARSSGYISHAAVVAKLSNEQRQRLAQLNQKTADLSKEISKLDVKADSDAKHLAWTELARTVFTFKEFIYVR